MEKLKHIKEDLECFLYDKIEADEENNYKNIKTCELEQVTKSIKNLSEAIYYCTVVEAMEEGRGTISYTHGNTTIPAEQMTN